MKKTRVAINGFGRIGRAFFKVAFERPEIEIAALNDPGDLENLAYLLKYDSAYGKSGYDIKVVNSEKSSLVVNGREIKCFAERDPLRLPWAELAIDVALESTGVFASYEKSRMHLKAGAKRVVVSAPVKDEPPEGVIGATVLMGVNEEKLKVCDISSNASCTTNAGSPLMQILNDTVGVKKALLNTVHGYTATQFLVDSPNSKDFRKGRAAATNMIPTTTGAAVAVTKALTDLAGKFDGIAIRVPLLSGSLADVTFLAGRATSIEEVNSILRKAADDTRWKNIFTVTDEPIVSSDIIGSHFASIADLSMTRVVEGDLVKVLAWYDNEMGYTYSLVEHVVKTGSYL